MLLSFKTILFGQDIDLLREFLSKTLLALLFRLMSGLKNPSSRSSLCILAARTEDLPLRFQTPKGSLNTALKCMGKYAEGSPMLLEFTDFEWKSAALASSSNSSTSPNAMQRLFKGLSFSRLMQIDDPDSDNMVKLKWFVIISQVAYSWQDE